MTEDARFEDVSEKPLRLIARSEEDLVVISALLQDAVATVGDISWSPKKRRFSMLLNRFRWEIMDGSDTGGGNYERVRTVLTVNDVLKVRASGLNPRDRDMVISVLSLAFVPGEECSGKLSVTVSGDGGFELDVECLDIEMTDATQPYQAVSGSRPKHPET